MFGCCSASFNVFCLRKLRVTRVTACREASSHEEAAKPHLLATNVSWCHVCVFVCVCACILQELSLEKLREMQGRTHEDPLREVAALQYLSGEGHSNILTCIEVGTEEKHCISGVMAVFRDLLELVHI